MDYIFFSLLKGNVAKRIVVSYDIACSWHKNLMTRCLSLPAHVTLTPADRAFENFISPQSDAVGVDHQVHLINQTSSPSHAEVKFDFVIPMFHIAAHGESCQDKFSLNYRPNMGRTDGENIERGWA